MFDIQELTARFWLSDQGRRRPTSWAMNMRVSMHLFFQNRIVQIATLLLIYWALAPVCPLSVHQGLYTISLLIKDLLLCILPLTVGLFIACSILSFHNKAALFILVLFLFEALSNSCSVWYAFGCGHVVAQFLPTIEVESLTHSFEPLWRLPLLVPPWWTASRATFVGVLFGLIASFNLPHLQKVIITGKEWIEKVLTNVFSRLIPLFILGFVAKMHQTHLIGQIYQSYADFLLWLCLSLVLYIAALFFVGAGFHFVRSLRSARHLLPAAGMAFSSGCSLSTMPWTIQGCTRSLQHPHLAHAVIPATTNIQQIGDCIVNAFLCFLIYTQFYGTSPSLSMWIPFSLVFVLTRYATAAVLGGAIFIMLPVYEAYLHFTPDMIAIILAFNVILDPIITCANVVANGALCLLFERVWIYLTKHLPSTSSTKPL
jgi:hypothetical protein